MQFRTRPIFVPLDYGRVHCVLDDLLKQKGLSKRELARQTGLRLDSIQKFCSNAYVQYPIDQLVVICAFLDCKITDILVYTPPAETIPQMLRRIAEDYDRREQEQILAQKFALEEQHFQEFLYESAVSSDFQEDAES